MIAVLCLFLAVASNCGVFPVVRFSFGTELDIAEGSELNGVWTVSDQEVCLMEFRPEEKTLSFAMVEKNPNVPGFQAENVTLTIRKFEDKLFLFFPLADSGESLMFHVRIGSGKISVAELSVDALLDFAKRDLCKIEIETNMGIVADIRIPDGSALISAAIENDCFDKLFPRSSEVHATRIFSWEKQVKKDAQSPIFDQLRNGSENSDNDR